MTTAAAIEAEIAALLAAEAGDVDEEPIVQQKAYRGPEIDLGHYFPPDTGCRLHPSCLSCPRAICIHDEPQGLRTAVVKFGPPVEGSLKDRARPLIAEGMSNAAIAAALGCHASHAGRIRRALTGAGTPRGRHHGARKGRILAALATGRSVRDVATDEGVSEVYVYRVRKQAA